MTISKLEPFYRDEFSFKTVLCHDLKASILIPKVLQHRSQQSYPIIVNWHGGGLVVGGRLYEGWLPTWLLDICISTPAIFIAPDYRLLPEATGAEILDDVQDFWHWLHDTLPGIAADWNAVPDLSRIACTGQSAGGYLAVQSALLFHNSSRVQFVASMGGSLHTDLPQYRIAGPRTILGKRPPPSAQAERVVRTYVKNMGRNRVRTEGDVVEMWDFLACALQQAYLSRWMGTRDNDRLDVMKVLERAKAMPPIWLIHGEQDSVVDPQCSIGFVEKLKQISPTVPVRLNLQPGDHGFESMHDGQASWIRQGVEFMRNHWG